MRRKRYFAVLLVVAVFACFSFSGIAENADAAAKRKTVKAPARVTGLKAASRNKTTASVKWKRVKKSSGYRVYLSSKNAKKGFKLAKTIKKNKTVRTTLKKLKANKKYYVKVRAFVKYKQGVKKYYNVKTKKWQTKKPKGKAWKGKKKTFKVTKYKYGKYSKVLKLGVYKVKQEDQTNTDTPKDGDNSKNDDAAKNDGTSNNDEKSKNDDVSNNDDTSKNGETSKNGDTSINETGSAYATYSIKGPATLYRGQEATFTVDAPADSAKKLDWYVSLDEFVKEKSGLSITIEIPEKTRYKEFSLQLTNYDGPHPVWGTDRKEVKIGLDSNLAGPNIEKTTDNFYVYRSGLPAPDGKVDIVHKIRIKAGSNWTKDNYKINVTEVTPKAYKELYRQLGYSDQMTYSVEYEDDLMEYITANEYGRLYYTGEAQPCTVITVTIHANAARVYKLTEASGKAIPDIDEDDGELRSARASVYVAPEYRDMKRNKTAEFYQNIYDKARKRLEAKLWTDDMTNLQKLSIISYYINATTHYPGTDATSKELNRFYWEEHAIDGEELFYSELNMTKLNKAMKLHGGITTCVAQSILIDVAEDDLGLPYLYDKEQDKVLDGEGVWTGTGSYSTNPASLSHETCYYKDAAGKKYAFDVQGLFTPCSKHNCKSIMVPLD